MEGSNYFLIGMPSSGKSTIGRHLANQLGLNFIDLDEVIVEEEGMAITEIFNVKGEHYFREAERKNLINQIEKKGGYVIATGGGAPCFFNNMDLMNNSGVTIFLDVSIHDLYNKLSKKGTEKRPLLKDMSSSDLFQELEAKLQERKKYYSQATICLEQKFNSVSERVNQVIEAIKSLEE